MDSAWESTNLGLAISVGVAAAVVAVVIAGLIARRAGPLLERRTLLLGALAASMTVIAVVTLSTGMGDPAYGASINLQPFVEIQRGLDASSANPAKTNLLGNVALFIPMGLALVWLWTSPLVARILMATIAGVGYSIAIEIVQLTLRRVADIDDVILNGSGALLGAIAASAVVLFVRFARLLARAARRRGRYRPEPSAG